MRPTAWVSVLAVSLLTAAVVNGMGAPHVPEAAPVKQPPPPLPSWVVTGQWKDTEVEAVDDALDRARDKVTEYLRAQKPPLEFPLDPADVRQRLWRDLKPEDPFFKDLVNPQTHEWEKAEGKTIPLKEGHLAQVETKPFEGLGVMYRAAVRIEITLPVKAEFERQEEQYQAKQRDNRATHRQGVLVRVLAALIAVLAAVAFYLRLEDATKGYYTTLLRLAAVAFVALVGAGIWLLT